VQDDLPGPALERGGAITTRARDVPLWVAAPCVVGMLIVARDDGDIDAGDALFTGMPSSPASKTPLRLLSRKTYPRIEFGSSRGAAPKLLKARADKTIKTSQRFSIFISFTFTGKATYKKQRP
jgi:hypothetical protein